MALGSVAAVAADRARMRFVLVAIGMVAASNTFGALTHAGPNFALASTMTTVAVMVGWTVWRHDGVLARWLLLGLVAGWLEIVTDAWLVAKTTTLIYPKVPPMVAASPLYMPFAWMLVLSQLGVVSGWLAQRMSLKKATLACAIAGGSMIPLYEHLAASADYWYYIATPMLMGAPLYIILAEFLIALPLAWMNGIATSLSLKWSLLLGAVLGLWMLPAVQVAWLLLGPCNGAWIQFRCA